MLTQREVSSCMKKIHGKQRPAKLRKIFNSQGNLDRGKGDAFENPTISFLLEVSHCVNHDIVEHAPLIFWEWGEVEASHHSLMLEEARSA